MPKPKAGRKERFRAALALAGLTAAEWARGEGITPQWLSMVLNGKESSATLTTKIDAFIGEHLDSRTTALAS